MVDDSTSLAIGITCWIIIHILILPHDIYWCYKFWKQRDELIIKKREPLLAIISPISLSIWVSLILTTEMILFENEEYRSSVTIRNTVVAINFLGYSPFIWIAAVFGVGRYWLIFYKISYNQAIVNNKWQSVLDPNIGKTNWYLQNIQKWGSSKFVKKQLIIYICIGVFFCNIGFLITFDFLHWSTMAGYSGFFIFGLLIPMIVSIIILCKIPSFQDDIGIRKELKFGVKLFVSCNVVFILFFIIIRIQSATSELSHAESNTRHIQWYLWYLFVRMFSSGLALISTRNILKTYKPILSLTNVEMLRSKSMLSSLVHKKTLAKMVCV